MQQDHCSGDECYLVSKAVSETFSLTREEVDAQNNESGILVKEPGEIEGRDHIDQMQKRMCQSRNRHLFPVAVSTNRSPTSCNSLAMRLGMDAFTSRTPSHLQSSQQAGSDSSAYWLQYFMFAKYRSVLYTYGRCLLYRPATQADA